MSLKEWTLHLFGKLGQNQEASTDRLNGGTSCYRPAQDQRKKKDAGEPPQMPYVHSGFTGMMPDPSDAYYEQGYSPYGMEPNGRYDNRSGGYMQDQWAGMQMNGYRQGGAPQDYNGMAERQGNIVYMPGVQPPAPVHVERILVLTSLQGCYDAIDGMRDNQTLIVLMDTIANEAEILRCQDMLMGAAFTLGCTVRILQGGRMLLIAPAGVLVLPEEREYRSPERGPEIFRSDLA